ncbi:MAG TPA: hypothetical protein VLL76_06390 [Candidatus Omnitrophota bacterium]|nr:hypothetical protein [Candidatus Omnitrophota bacterium]
MRRNSILCGTACAALLAAASAVAQVPQPPRVIDYPQEGVQLGTGWHSQTASKTSSICVVFQEAHSQIGQQVVFDKAQVSDRYSLARSIDVSAEWHLKAGILASKTVDAKAHYASKTRIDESSLVVTELVTVDNGYAYAAPAAVESQKFGAALQGQSPMAHDPAKTQRALGIDPRMVDAHAGQTLSAHIATAKSAKQRHNALGTGLNELYKAGGSTASSVRLTDDMAALLKSNPGEFRRLCGDGFVAGIKQGGELAATYTFHTYSKSQQDDISAKLGFKVNGIVSDYSGSVSVSRSIRQNNLNQKLSIDYFQQGGSGEPIPVTLDAIDAAVTSFAGAVKTAPFNYKIVIVDYGTLPGGGGTLMADMSSFDKVTWEYAKAEQTYQTASDLLEAVYTLEGAKWPQKAYLFGRWGYDKTDLQKVQANALTRLNQMKGLAQNCAAGNCTAPDVWDDLAARIVFPLPIPDYNLTGSDQVELVRTLVGDPAWYTRQVTDYWIRRANSQRCQFDRDPLFCKPDLAFNNVPDLIKTARPRLSLLFWQNCFGNSGGSVVYKSCSNDPTAKDVFYNELGQLQGDTNRNLCLTEDDKRHVSFRSCSEKGRNRWSFVQGRDGELYFKNSDTNLCISEYETTICGVAPKPIRDAYKFKIRHALADKWP